MPTYGAISWLPFTLGLTGAGLFLSWLAWQRRGIAAGIRGLSLSLLPMVAYLTGVLQLVWRVVAAAVSWAVHLVFSPALFIGVALGGLALLLHVVANRLSARAPRRRTERITASATPKRVAPASPPPVAAADDDFADIEELLRKRGIS